MRVGADAEKDVKSKLDAMLAIASEPTSQQGRTLKFQFLATPIEIKGNGKVEEVVFKKSESDETFSIPCGLVITAIGYESNEIEGIPFEKGRVANTEGHIKDNLYVVGWAKRGPSGVIGTNKSDAADVMKLLVANLPEPKNSSDPADIVGHNKVVTQMHWERINAAEVAAGEALGKPRKKAVSREELLNLGAL